MKQEPPRNWRLRSRLGDQRHGLRYLDHSSLVMASFILIHGLVEHVLAWGAWLGPFPILRSSLPFAT
jgi:hypothetical protein